MIFPREVEKAYSFLFLGREQSESKEKEIERCIGGCSVGSFLLEPKEY